jgi:hypothetical protein
MTKAAPHTPSCRDILGDVFERRVDPAQEGLQEVHKSAPTTTPLAWQGM